MGLLLQRVTVRNRQGSLGAVRGEPGHFLGQARVSVVSSGMPVAQAGRAQVKVGWKAHGELNPKLMPGCSSLSGYSERIPEFAMMLRCHRLCGYRGIALRP